MNLFERLKPEVLVALNKYTATYPMSGDELKEALKNKDFVSNLRYGHVVELLSLVPYKQNQSPYGLFLGF
jgi:hypothetical protein